jgi:hypothetical protein
MTLRVSIRITEIDASDSIKSYRQQQQQQQQQQ